MTTLYEINKELLALVNNYESNVENATDEVVEFQNDMFEKLNLAFNDKIKHVAMAMREKEWEATIIDNEIKRLLALKTNKLNTVEKLKNYISRALQSQQIEKLDLDIFKFSFKPSEQMKVIEWSQELLPDDLVYYSLDDDLNKEQANEISKLWYEVTKCPKWLTEIKKRYKWLIQERDEKILELGNNLNADVITKEEHDDEMKKIKEEKHAYEWKIRIEEKQNLQIK